MGLKSGGLCFFDSGFCGFHERSEHQKEREMDIPGSLSGLTKAVISSLVFDHGT